MVERGMLMEQMKVIIADDDNPSRMLLLHFIQMLPEYSIVGEASTGDELVELVMSEKPDIALVDINMPRLNGVEAVKVCKRVFPSLQVIFTTGYDEFAVEAFNLSASDYIVKPIERSRLFMALEKAKRSLQICMKQAKSCEGKTKKLAVKSNNTYFYLPLDDLLYIEKEGRKTVLHMENDRLETNESLQELEERLPSTFYKTHRSYLVNLKKVKKIVPSGETYLVYFAGSNKGAQISKLKINEVQKLIGS